MKMLWFFLFKTVIYVDWSQEPTVIGGLSWTPSSEHNLMHSHSELTWNAHEFTFHANTWDPVSLFEAPSEQRGVPSYRTTMEGSTSQTMTMSPRRKPLEAPIHHGQLPSVRSRWRSSTITWLPSLETPTL
jgi:hypothetical protein